MGNSPRKLEGDSECITDEKWSKQLESYLGIEDVDVEADLIYHFDGKSSSGNSSSLSMYRFSSTNYCVTYFNEAINTILSYQPNVLKFTLTDANKQSNCLVH